MNRSPDVKAKVKLLSTEAGGRKNPSRTGYRPNHLITDDYLTSGEHTYLDREEVAPGESALAEITFLDPHAYPHSLWVGKVINIQEGGWIVGSATILEIYNPLLKKEP